MLVPPLSLLLLVANPVWPVSPAQPSTQTKPRVVCDTTGCFVSWDVIMLGLHKPCATPLTTSGPGAVWSIAAGSPNRIFQSTGSGGGIRLHLASPDGSAGDSSIYVAMMSATSGTHLDDLGSVVLSDNDGVTGQNACAFSGARFLCAQTYATVGANFSEIRYRQLDPTGALIEPAPVLLFPASNHQIDPAIAFSAGRYVVAWANRQTGSQFDISAAVLSSDGGLVRAPFMLTSDLDDDTGTAAVAIDGGVLVAFSETLVPERLRAVLVGDDGGTTPVNMGINGGLPALSWHGDRLLVAVEIDAADGGSVVQGWVMPWSPPAAPSLIFTSPGPADVTPWVAAVDGERAVLTYAAGSTDGGSRVVATYLGLRGLGETCGSPVSCVQGVCSGTSGLCTLDAGTPDAGPPDAGPPDAGTPDAGTPDAGGADAGRPDAGGADAGGADAGGADAGGADAGGADAGSPDSGNSDAGDPNGNGADSGTASTGSPDGGPRPPYPVLTVGCGCSLPGSPMDGIVVVLGLVLVRWRRRRRSQHS